MILRQSPASSTHVRQRLRRAARTARHVQHRLPHPAQQPSRPTFFFFFCYVFTHKRRCAPSGLRTTYTSSRAKRALGHTTLSASHASALTARRAAAMQPAITMLTNSSTVVFSQLMIRHTPSCDGVWATRPSCHSGKHRPRTSSSRHRPRVTQTRHAASGSTDTTAQHSRLPQRPPLRYTTERTLFFFAHHFTTRFRSPFITVLSFNSTTEMLPTSGNDTRQSQHQHTA